MSASSARSASWWTTSARTGQSRHLAKLPLIAHSRPDAVIAYRAGKPLSVARFLADVARLRPLLGAGQHVLNVCADRYAFAVGFAAALTSGKVSLLPPTHTAEVIECLKGFAPDVVCLTDNRDCAIRLPLIVFPEGEDAGAPATPVPELDASQGAACVFTSGSTGTPIPYRKSWGPLMRCVREEARRLGLAAVPVATVVATVPPQHMYGFESSVLMPLATGHAFAAERPFYPADVAAALARVPRPRVLVSTPVHLRALASSGMTLPTTDLVVSATAPLSQQLAAEIERRFTTQLLEIYGSTETGQIAARRPTRSPEWQLFPGVTLATRDGETWAHGGHIEQPTRMCDVIEMLDEERFLLHGRHADLVNIAGKRSSLAHLNHHLNSIPGVHDGAFFHFEHAHAAPTEVARVAACVVAPTLTHAQILEELRRRVDPVFLPRPLLFVARLPRNSTGKLPQDALRELAEAHLKASVA